ncbi:MAG: fasciclin domain-containing protein, partial [Planctomycetes bacterium]|nr:fasciclin domain-containing protein [Planctomycetota bacterium]
MTKTLIAAVLLTGALTAQASILETAVKDGRFETLVAALGKSTAIETLKGKGPFTVFAPTDEAFAKLDQQAVADLLKPRNRATLDNLLTYHVTTGSLSADDVTRRAGLDMANGQRLPVRVHGKTVRVGDAKVVLTDIRCSNGVIHVVDAVLMPEARDLTQIANSRYFGTLLAAVKAAGLIEPLSGKGPFT